MTETICSFVTYFHGTFQSRFYEIFTKSSYYFIHHIFPGKFLLLNREFRNILNSIFACANSSVNTSIEENILRFRDSPWPETFLRLLYFLLNMLRQTRVIRLWGVSLYTKPGFSDPANLSSYRSCTCPKCKHSKSARQVFILDIVVPVIGNYIVDTT